jgi:hypothetical protein
MARTFLLLMAVGSVPAGLYAPCLMGSKVPGAVVTDPPTAKLPCSWIVAAQACSCWFLSQLAYSKPEETFLYGMA